MVRKRGAVKITKAVVDSLPFTEKGQQYLYDSVMAGFGVCIGKTAKSYFVETTVAGKRVTRRITIGRHGIWTTEDARQEARKLLLKMKQGIDPVDEREQQRQSHEKAIKEHVTLREVWNSYKRDRQLRPGTLRDYANYIVGSEDPDQPRKSVFHDWLDRPCRAISRSDIIVRHTQIGQVAAQRGNQIGQPRLLFANSAMRVLGSVLSYAKACGLIDANPVEVLGEAKKWSRERRRRSVVQPHQIRTWLEAVESVRRMLPAGPLGCDYLELVLFTGLRRNEAASLTWAQIDFDRKTLTLPDPKNYEPHILPLTEHIVAVLRRRREANRESKWVFPSPGRKNRQGHLAEPRCVALKVKEVSGVTFTIHDLRRTFISTAEALDLPYYAIKKLANHKMSGDVTAGYIVCDAERLRAPMQKITDYFLFKLNEVPSLKIAAA